MYVHVCTNVCNYVISMYGQESYHTLAKIDSCYVKNNMAIRLCINQMIYLNQLIKYHQGLSQILALQLKAGLTSLSPTCDFTESLQPPYTGNPFY